MPVEVQGGGMLERHLQRAGDHTAGLVRYFPLISKCHPIEGTLMIHQHFSGPSFDIKAIPQKPKQDLRSGSEQPYKRLRTTCQVLIRIMQWYVHCAALLNLKLFNVSSDSFSANSPLKFTHWWWKSILNSAVAKENPKTGFKQQFVFEVGSTWCQATRTLLLRANAQKPTNFFLNKARAES